MVRICLGDFLRVIEHSHLRDRVCDAGRWDSKILRKRTNENFDVLLSSSMIGLDAVVSCVGDKAQMMGIRGVEQSSMSLAFTSYLPSGGIVWMHHGWPHSFDRCFAADGAKLDQASLAGTQGWHAVIIPIPPF
jgi:hypothetical protein